MTKSLYGLPKEVHKMMVDAMVDEFKDKPLYEAPILTPEQMEKLISQMEEFANAPKEEYGKRQPGERGMYEIQRRENLRERLEQPTMGKGLYGWI